MTRMSKQSIRQRLSLDSSSSGTTNTVITTRKWCLSVWAVIGPLVGMWIGSQQSSLGSLSPSSSSSTSESGTMMPRSQDLLPHLKDCDRVQSKRSLAELAELYRPSKFWTYAHSSYDRFYPHYLENYRHKYFKMLEIGLDTGQGTLLWQEYFPCAELVGLEYNPDNTQNEGATRIQSIVGDQGNATFLETDFMEQTGGGDFDVILDDGGHHYEQQRTSYEVLFQHALKPGGLYILEDIETSYWQKNTLLYGLPVTRGGQSEPNTIVNHFKKIVDVVNKKFFDNTYHVMGPVDQWIATLTFASNLIVLTKKDHTHCYSERTYVWPKRLAKDCPAQTQPPNVLRASQMHQYCGDAILEPDQANSRDTFPTDYTDE